VRSDLLAVLEDSREWELRVVQAGETNVKGCLLASLVDAYIKGLIARVDKEEFPELLVKAAEHGVDVCTAILEGKVGELQGEKLGDGGAGIGAGPGGGEAEHTPEDWDFLVCSMPCDKCVESGGDDELTRRTDVRCAIRFWRW
jgi:hypothetical protein